MAHDKTIERTSMNKDIILAACTAAAAAGLYGETVSGGGRGRLQLDGPRVVIAPKLANKQWRFFEGSGGYVPESDGIYAFSIKDDKAVVIDGRAKFMLTEGVMKAE